MIQNNLKKSKELRRIVIIGTSCSGKTTFAKKLAEVLGYKHIEMDWINWLPDWQERPIEEFRDLVSEETSAENWVLDGNYSKTRDIVWERATHIIWLNYSFPVVFSRAVRRTIMRSYTKEEVCGGNHETFKQSFLSTDSMILWVLKTYHSRRYRYKKQIKENENRNLRFIVINNSKDSKNFLKNIK